MARRTRLEIMAALLSLACAVPVLVAYLTNLDSGPFEDDFGLVNLALAAQERGAGSVWWSAFGSPFFRPFNLGLVYLSLEVGSWALAHGVSLLVHVVLAALVGWLTGRLMPSRRSPWLAVAVASAFFVHQGNTTAVLQIDTVSQSLGDLFSFAGIAAAFGYAAGGRLRWVPVAAAAALLAMLGKEGGVSTALGLIATVGLLGAKGTRMRRVAIMATASLIAGAAYLVWRANVRDLIPAGETTGRYAFGLGLSTVRHAAQFLFIEIVPWNSASLLWNRSPHEWAAGLTIAVLIVVVAGLGWRHLASHEPWSKIVLVWLAVVFLVWCAPYVFLARVSEQYVYRLACVTVLALGFGCWAHFRSGLTRLAAPALAAWFAWVGVSAAGSIQKCALLKQNAHTAGRVLETAAGVLGDVSETEEIWVFITPSHWPREHYSILYVPEPALWVHSHAGLRWYLKKPNLRIEMFLPGRRILPKPTPPGRLKKIQVNVVEGRAELMPAGTTF